MKRENIYSVNRKVLLVFDTAYTYRHIKSNGLEIFVESRNAAQIFDETLTINPIASLQSENPLQKVYGRPKHFKLDEKNYILEGNVARFEFLARLPRLNFALAQISLLFTLFGDKRLKHVKLIRAEDPLFNGIYGIFFARILRRPLIVGLGGNPDRIRELTGKTMMPRLFKKIKTEERLEKFVLLRAKKVLALNNENLSYALRVGVLKSRTSITPLGVGIDRAHFLPIVERTEVIGDLRRWEITDQKILVCVSRLESLKMVDHAILAAKVVKDSRIPFKLILVGDGREMNNLKTLVETLGLKDEVVFAGNRDQEWIAGLMAHANINLAPLCGRSLLEASLAGCPAVAYDVDWHNEIVIPGSTGELVTNLDFTTLGFACVKILENPAYAHRLGQNIKSLAVSLSEPEVMIQKQIGVYSEFIK
jgi:glycosyltransferase involved in cell wall biosynthesis